MTRFLAALACASALGAFAVTPAPGPKIPSTSSRTMTNVYLLAHAGAILDICLASPARETLSPERAEELTGLSTRLVKVVESMSAYQRDKTLPAVYESTKASLAADTKLRFHTKNNHRNCGDRFTGEMRTYVADNEKLIGEFLERTRAAAAAKAARPAEAAKPGEVKSP